MGREGEAGRERERRGGGEREREGSEKCGREKKRREIDNDKGGKNLKINHLTCVASFWRPSRGPDVDDGDLAKGGRRRGGAVFFAAVAVVVVVVVAGGRKGRVKVRE